MGLNTATIVIVLKEHETNNENYYVRQTHNPDSVLGNINSFSDLIYYSDVFINRKRAIEYAQELEFIDPTTHGILIYDGLSSMTLGEAKLKIEKKTGYVSRIH